MDNCGFLNRILRVPSLLCSAPTAPPVYYEFSSFLWVFRGRKGRQKNASIHSPQRRPPWWAERGCDVAPSGLEGLNDQFPGAHAPGY